MEVIITKSTNKNKKYDAIVDGKKISFGAAGASNVTIHKNETRKQEYIARHAKREDWNKSGITTAGYWSKHLLWSKDMLQKPIDDFSRKRNLHTKMK